MPKEKGSVVSVKIVRTEQGAPPGKLADAELIFEAGSGPLSGLLLIGFAVWERRNGSGRNVTFPARQYSVNGEGTQYARFTASNTRIKKRNGSATSWWLRSPHSNVRNGFCALTAQGAAAYGYASESFGVCFGFCI